MKAEIKNINITLGDREFEFTMEELKALKKAIDDFLPKQASDWLKDYGKDITPKKYPKDDYPIVPQNPWNPDKLPWNDPHPYKIWCQVRCLDPDTRAYL